MAVYLYLFILLMFMMGLTGKYLLGHIAALARCGLLLQTK